MLNLESTLWAGSEASYDAAVSALAKAQASGMKAGPMDDDECPYGKAGNVAIIPIYGSLVNIDSPILKYFGITGYPVLRRAVIAAAQDQGIDHILLDVNSPGGAVSGIADTGDLLKRVNAKVKPITTFTGGIMHSAACWLGVSAGQVFASRTADVGSIGVIQVHTEVTKMLDTEGVKKTVLRAGEFKALANPFEVLSDAARLQVQEGLDGAYKVFAQHVADCRGVSFSVVDLKMAQGRTFFGIAAKTAGLVDGISSLDAVVSALQSKKVDKPKRYV